MCPTNTAYWPPEAAANHEGQQLLYEDQVQLHTFLGLSHHGHPGAWWAPLPTEDALDPEVAERLGWLSGTTLIGSSTSPQLEPPSSLFRK